MTMQKKINTYHMNRSQLVELVGVLYEQKNELLEALKRTEQTLRNLADSMLIGDAYTIASNEAANIRAAIAKGQS